MTTYNGLELVGAVVGHAVTSDRTADSPVQSRLVHGDTSIEAHDAIIPGSECRNAFPAEVELPVYDTGTIPAFDHVHATCSAGDAVRFSKERDAAGEIVKKKE